MDKKITKKRKKAFFRKICGILIIVNKKEI